MLVFRQMYDPQSSTYTYLVGDKRSAGESIAGAKPNLGRDLIADEPDDTGEGKQPKVGQRPWVKEPLNRLPQRDQRTDEDRENNS